MKPRFISDLHLSENNPKLVEAFLKFLQESKQVCTHFYILGDLFEAWIGDDDDSLLSNKVKKALYEFTNDGPKTFFIHGNRDFLIGNSFAEDTGITILPDPYVLDINNQNVVISHGDFLCTDDKDYISFRNEVRSEEWQSNFLNKSLIERKHKFKVAALEKTIAYPVKLGFYLGDPRIVLAFILLIIGLLVRPITRK